MLVVNILTSGHMSEVKGRWDIDFVENPRYQPKNTTIDPITKAWLIAIAESHPRAWAELKKAMQDVDEMVK